jgi:hypothetical protein
MLGQHGVYASAAEVVWRHTFGVVQGLIATRHVRFFRKALQRIQRISPLLERATPCDIRRRIVV